MVFGILAFFGFFTFFSAGSSSSMGFILHHGKTKVLFEIDVSCQFRNGLHSSLTKYKKRYADHMSAAVKCKKNSQKFVRNLKKVYLCAGKNLKKV